MHVVNSARIFAKSLLIRISSPHQIRTATRSGSDTSATAILSRRWQPRRLLGSRFACKAGNGSSLDKADHQADDGARVTAEKADAQRSGNGTYHGGVTAAPPPAGFQPHAAPATPSDQLQGASAASAPSSLSPPLSPGGGGLPSRLLPSVPRVNWGIIGLLAVSFLWGTFGPAVKWMYAAEPSLTPSILTGARTLLEAVFLLSLTLGRQTVTQQQQQQQAAAAHAKESSSASGSGTGSGSILPLVLGGLELGLYNFAGNALEAQALALTSASRSAFLVQLTLVFTPLLSAVAGYRVPPLLWASCLLGLVGGVLLASDGQDVGALLAEVTWTRGGDVAAASSAASGGAAGLLSVFLSHSEFMLLGTCFFYALALVRLQRLSPAMSSLSLATAKKVVLAMLAAGWAASDPQGEGRDNGGAELLGQQTYRCEGCGRC